MLARFRDDAGAWDEDWILRLVHQLGRDLFGLDSLRHISFFIPVRRCSGVTRNLPGLHLELRERERAHVALYSAQCDALAEDVHGHDFLLAQLRRDDLPFLGEALATLHVEVMLVTETAHQ